MASVRNRLGPLRHRAFRALFAGQLVSFAGTAMAPIALSFAVLQLSGSATDLGIVLAAYGVPQFCCIVFGGVVADRFPRQHVLVVSSLTAAAAQSAVSVLLLSHSAHIWQLALLELVNGTADAFLLPSGQGAVPQTVPRRMLQQANALIGLATHGAMVAGAALAGVIVAVAGPGWGIAADALSFLLAAAFFLRLRLPAVVRDSRAGAVAQFAEGWREFRARRWLWAMAVQAAVAMGAVAGGFQVLGPIVANTHLGGAASWGLIVSAKSAGVVAGGVLSLWLRASRPLVLAELGVLLYVPVFFLLAAPAPLAAVIAAATLSGVGIQICAVQWETAVQCRVPEAKLSRVLAFDSLLTYALMPIGQAAASPAAHVFGVDHVLWAVGALVALTVVAGLSVGDIRALRAEPAG